jgi:catechol 2,3-dioxygenase-like lactoylglutathione lyase family enzyme
MKDTSDNSEVFHPTLHHYGLVVSNTDAMVDWYGKVLGTSPVHQSAKPAGAQTPLGARADWVSNDKANHRIAFIKRLAAACPWIVRCELGTSGPPMLPLITESDSNLTSR